MYYFAIRLMLGTRDLTSVVSDTEMFDVIITLTTRQLWTTFFNKPMRRIVSYNAGNLTKLPKTKLQSTSINLIGTMLRDSGCVDHLYLLRRRRQRDFKLN
ncbi:hypothetical protein NP493_2065g00006 [Ridgeia piscesae]|uniref:Uncharacterized protein n=1 Tax=Ridgeia piscesae TaxID=27915 RepID=A0AAD9N4W7_RIDPI|nr:hypothetical protein NP493_2065g00003 [Ridgeia piscesae]KAK2155558.1 hypothetical protein NP493_2065g00006 [Ridgeia piscesae]